MPKGPTWNQIGDPNLGNLIVARDCGGYLQKQSRPGKTRVLLKCPFCQKELWAYTWSLAAGGKRCGCGAMASGNGTFYHFADRKQ